MRGEERCRGVWNSTSLGLVVPQKFPVLLGRKIHTDGRVVLSVRLNSKWRQVWETDPGHPKERLESDVGIASETELKSSGSVVKRKKPRAQPEKLIIEREER